LTGVHGDETRRVLAAFNARVAGIESAPSPRGPLFGVSVGKLQVISTWWTTSRPVSPGPRGPRRCGNRTHRGGANAVHPLQRAISAT
jgi:hypothetical protein